MYEDWPKFEHSARDRGIPRLLTAIGLAAYLGMSRQRVSKLLSQGRLPPPVALVNDERPAWLSEQFQTSDTHFRLVIERDDIDSHHQ